MKALTLIRPWPFAILHLGKRIENRSHDQFKRYRGPLLIHAGKSWDGGAAWCRSRGLADMSQYQRMSSKLASPAGIVGRCRVVGHVQPYRDSGVVAPVLTIGRYELADDPFRWGATIMTSPDRYVHAKGEVDLALGDALDMRWWMGGHGLILADVEALDEPIPCKGRLGLWTPPDDVLEQLPEGWRECTTTEE